MPQHPNHYPDDDAQQRCQWVQLYRIFVEKPRLDILPIKKCTKVGKTKDRTIWCDFIEGSKIMNGIGIVTATTKPKFGIKFNKNVSRPHMPASGI